MDEKNVAGLLNKSVITYRAASYWGARDYRCVEILMEKDLFEKLESIFGEIKGRIGKQYEGNN